MLRRMTNNQDITPLKIFVDVVDLVKNYQPHFQGVTYTGSSPLALVVDWEIRPLQKKLSEVSELGILAGKHFISQNRPFDAWIERSLAF